MEIPKIEEMVSPELLASIPKGVHLVILENELPEEHVQAVAAEILKGTFYMTATPENSAPIRLHILGLHPSEDGKYFMAARVCEVIQ